MNNKFISSKFISPLVNRIDKKILKEKISLEKACRKTISFYRYHPLDNLLQLRNKLYSELNEISVLGRIYIASEGINAQVSVLQEKVNEFKAIIQGYDFAKNIEYRIALEEKKFSFYKLKIKVRDKIVADGLKENFASKKRGKSLSALEVNQAIKNSDALLVDVRNHYEAEVGHFENALTFDEDTFREIIPQMVSALEKIERAKDKKIILYCTGGIRCEKASAYLLAKGYKDVNQIKGGIIDYVKTAQEKNLDNFFKGKNFVFDERLGEKASNEVIAKCHQCGEPCDEHTNCANDDCHLLFIQCEVCRNKMDNCCSEKCRSIIKLPLEEQKLLRKGRIKKDSLAVYKSRLRPRLNLNIK